MIRFVCLAFLLLSGLACAQPLALTHVTVIDATGTPPQPDMTVLIDGARIKAVGKSGETALPGDARTVDAAGKFLIPGLWDMHVHWNDAAYLGLFVANGVTGVRVMWGEPRHLEQRRKIAAGELVGPRMVLAGTIVDGPKPFWKGSIAVDGISLTVAGLGHDRFDVQVVPYTMDHTNLSGVQIRDRVNLECDMIGKYVVRAAELAGLTLTGVRPGEVTH